MRKYKCSKCGKSDIRRFGEYKQKIIEKFAKRIGERILFASYDDDGHRKWLDWEEIIKIIGEEKTKPSVE